MSTTLKQINKKKEALHEALASDKVVFGFWVYLMTDLLMFGVLFASASFIAAPAVLRTAIPRANPSLYITSALGITFPYIIIALLPILLIISTTFHNLGSISLFN